VSNSQALYAAERFQANTGGTVGQFGGNAGAHDPATNISWRCGTTRFRDPSAWYHWVFVADTTNATEADRIRFYINGERITISGTNLISQDYLTGWNAAVTTTIFDAADPSDAGNVNFEGYLADFYNIDGQALEPTAFGRENADGVWVPVAYDGDADDYGVNGFHLTFEDPDDIGADSAPIGATGHTAANDFTPSGFELTDDDDPDYDLMQDSPTQNYATINPLNVTGPAFNPNTLSANLQANLTRSQADWASTGSISITEPTYFEGTFVTHCSIGVAEANVNNNSRCNLVAGSGTAFTQDNMGNQSNVNVGLPGTLSSGTIGCRVDPVNRTVAWTYDGATWSNNITYNAVDNPVMPYISAGVAQPSNTDLFINFGQQPFIHPVPTGFERLQTQNLPEAPIANGRDHFQAITGAGQGADSSDPDTIVGAFSSTWTASGDGWGSRPPASAFSTDTSDFLNNNTGGQTVTWDTSSFNLSGELTILQRASGDPYRMLVDGVEVIASIATGANGSETDYTVTIDNPSSIVWEPAPDTEGGICIYNFQLDGDNLRDGSILALAQQAFPTGLWWIKDRENNNQHQISNSVLPADSWAECPGDFTAFDAYQPPDGDSVAWCWGGDEVTGADLTAVNANGDLDLIGLVRNVDAGMSSGYYNGSPDGSTQSPGTQLSIPHGLSRAPEFVAVTLMDDNGTGSTNTWQAYSSSPAARADRALILRASDAGFDPDFFWTTEQEATTDTLIRVRVSPSALVSNDLNRRRTCGYDSNYFFMAFHSVPGYSAFGSYVGNGDSSGPMIWTGFRPSFVMVKRATGTSNWQIMDSTINPSNPANIWIEANEPTGEQTGNAFIQEDFLSNGFKPRGGASQQDNLNGQTYIYCCWAENPFQAPVTAR
jgi:hypothetical protein